MKFNFDESEEWMDANECSTDNEWNDLTFDWDFDTFEVNINGDENLINEFVERFNLF